MTDQPTIEIAFDIEPLEEIDDILPVGTRLKLGGLAPQLTSPLLKGHTYVTVVFGGIDNVAFPEDAKRGTMRVHTQHVAEAYVLPQPLAGELLEACRVAHAAEMAKLFPPVMGPLDEALEDLTEDQLQEMLREEGELEAIEAAAANGRTPGADDGWPEHVKDAGGIVGESIEERVRDVAEPKSPREIERDRRLASTADAMPADDAYFDPALVADDARRDAGAAPPLEEEL